MLLVSLDGFAVFGSDLILLCTTSTRLVFNNVQNLRRVRVPSSRSPMMTKPPRALAHSPILYFCCAPCLWNPNEPLSHAFFFARWFWPGSYAYASVTRSLALDRSRYRYSVRCWLSNALVARRCSHFIQNHHFSSPAAALAALVLQKSSMVCPVRFPCKIA